MVLSFEVARLASRFMVWPEDWSALEAHGTQHRVVRPVAERLPVSSAAGEAQSAGVACPLIVACVSTLSVTRADTAAVPPLLGIVAITFDRPIAELGGQTPTSK